jgi:hypothetical protein
MHVTLCCPSLAFLLLCASAGAASAMDQSATEETNCLMACDANQEHCATNPPAPTPKNYSQSRFSPPTPIKSSPAIRPRRTNEGR